MENGRWKIALSSSYRDRSSIPWLVKATHRCTELQARARVFLTGRSLAASSVNTFQQALPWIISAPNQAVLQIRLKPEREGTACFGTECRDDSVRERTATLLEGNHCGENLLLVLHNQYLGLKYPLDSRSDFMLRKTIRTVEHPDRLDHGRDAHEAGIFRGKSPFDDLGSFRRLNRIVLGKITDNYLGIEPNHRRRLRGVTPVAPSAAMAAAISATVTGRRLRDLTLPRIAEAGSFGKSTTVPSGCTKNFTRSPGFNRRCSRIAFGIVACPLTVIADSIAPPLHFNRCNTTLSARRQGSRFPV